LISLLLALITKRITRDVIGHSRLIGTTLGNSVIY